MALEYWKNSLWENVKASKQPCTRYYRITNAASGQQIAPVWGKNVKDEGKMAASGAGLAKGMSSDEEEQLIKQGVFATAGKDALLWRFDFIGSDQKNGDCFSIVNRRSGLWLHYTKKRKDLLEVSSEPRLWDSENRRDAEGACYLEILETRPADGSISCRIRTCDTKGVVRHVVGRNFTNNNATDLMLIAVKSKQPDDKDVWELQPSNFTQVAAPKAAKKYTYASSGVDMGLTYASNVVAIFAELSGLIGNGINTATAYPLNQAHPTYVDVLANTVEFGVAAYAFSGGFGIISTALSIGAIGKAEGEADPFQSLYEKMMPEIDTMMKDNLREAFTQDNVDDALADIIAARQTWRMTTSALREHLDNLAESASKKADAGLILDDFNPVQKARVADLLSQSDQQFRRGVSKLMVKRNVRAGFVLFIQAAMEHTAVMVLLSAIYPRVDGTNAGGFVRNYLSFAEAALKERYFERMQSRIQVKNNAAVDNFYGDRRKYQSVFYDHHISRTLDIDLGLPSGVINSWKRTLNTIETAAKAKPPAR